MTVVLIAGAFITGSLPFGWLYVKLFKGRDVREIGSGSTGATNVYRAAGIPAALLVFFLDFAKAFVFPFCFGGSYALKVALGLTAVLGHNFSIFLKGRGGKGVASSAGVAAALAPAGLVMSLAVFALSFAVSRIISLSSIIGAAAFALFCFLLDYPPEVRLFALAVFIFIVISHRKNIQRLFRGEEKRIDRQ